MTKALKRIPFSALVFSTMFVFASGCSHGQARGADFESRLRPTISFTGQATPQWTVEDRMAYHNVPGLSLAILVDGEIKFAKGYGVLSIEEGEPVTADTVFSVGSVSKMVTAATTLKLHQQSVLDVDSPITDYLSSWKVPETEIPNADTITLRMIMSHTAGFSVHGFDDYMPNETVPNIVQILNGESPAKSPPVKIILEPGTTFKYSGGGVTVEQVILSDILEKPFEIIMQETLFGPLKMGRSTFANPIPSSHGNIAKAHDYRGQPAARPRGWPAMPEQAASGLWTSANDLGLFVSSLIKSHRGDASFLRTDIVQDMMTPVGTGAGFSPRLDASESGMGPRIDTSFGELTFNHPGANDHYRAWIEGNLETGSGLVILTNSESGNALMTEIRNAVSDAYGWKTNPIITLDKTKITSSNANIFEEQYVRDTRYPTSVQRQLSAYPSLQNVNGSFKDGSIILGDERSKVSLRLERLDPSN